VEAFFPGVRPAGEKKKTLFFLPLRLFLCVLRDFVVQPSKVAGEASFELKNEE
jgi:hypothetical protein